MKINTLNEWLNESNQGFLEPTKENLEKFDLNLGKVTINSDGSIDYNGEVDFSGKKLSKIPFKFNKVTGNFYCSYNYLINLEGCPNEVLGEFDCSHNRLINLGGSPKEVAGDFDCSNNQLISLFGNISYISGEFDCSYNIILYNPTTFKGSFKLNSIWGRKNSSDKWEEHTGAEYLKMAFKRLDELSEVEILGIEEGLNEVEMSAGLRAYCQNKLFKFLVKFNPKTKLRQVLSGTDDQIIDMF